MASLILVAPPMAMASHSSVTLSHRISFPNSQALGQPLTSSSASSLSITLITPSFPSNPWHCGRGNQKSAEGNHFNHSLGNARPRNKKKGRGPPRVPFPAAPSRKDRFDDGVVKIEIDESIFSS